MSSVILGVFFFSTFTLAANDTDVGHGIRDLMCRPASWTDVAIFYIGNYVAHAATLNTSPGQSMVNSAFAILTALLVPGAGLVRGMRAIRSRAPNSCSPLRRAAIAGALCVLVPYDEGSDPNLSEGPRAEEVVNDEGESQTAPPQTFRSTTSACILS